MSVKNHITIRVIQILCARGTIPKNDNRKHIVLQNHYFTFQRQYDTNHLDLQIQFMHLQIEQMQTQIDSLSSGGSGSGGGDPDGVGTMYFLFEYLFILYIQLCRN